MAGGERTLKLHVQLSADPPAEHFILTGSHPALGKWTPFAGVRLQWQNGEWVTEHPVNIAPCGRVEFKFACIKSGVVQWESGPNRVMEVPETDLEMHLDGTFNGNTTLRFDKAERKTEKDSDVDIWQSLFEEAVKARDLQLRQMAAERSERLSRRECCAKTLELLKSELAQAEREAVELHKPQASDHVSHTCRMSISSRSPQAPRPIVPPAWTDQRRPETVTPAPPGAQRRAAPSQAFSERHPWAHQQPQSPAPRGHSPRASQPWSSSAFVQSQEVVAAFESAKARFANMQKACQAAGPKLSS